MVGDTNAIALLLAEGETAKAKALKDWLDTNARAERAEARVVLWRTYFAHMAAAERYLQIARDTSGVPGKTLMEPRLGHATHEVCDGCGAIEGYGESHAGSCGVAAHPAREAFLNFFADLTWDTDAQEATVSGSAVAELAKAFGFDSLNAVEDASGVRGTGKTPDGEQHG